MAAIAFLVVQLPPINISLGVVILVLVGLLLLAMAVGGLLALRLRPDRQTRKGPEQTHPASVEAPSPLADVLNALPFPAACIRPNGQLLVVNAEAMSWLDTDSPPSLISPLRTLTRRVVTSQERETIQVAFGEGQPPLQVQASPLCGDGQYPERPAGATLYGVLLLALPGDTGTSLDLTRLVAHELRTPLTAIVGHAEILESCEPTDEVLWRRSCDFIAAETQRLRCLVDDLLALSGVEASPPLIRTVNLRVVVESALSHLFDSAETAGLNLTLDAPANLPRVRADHSRLEQALVNLLDNAIKYTPATGTVTARLSSEGGYVRIEIIDTGLGIPPEDLPHLFEPLYRAECVRHLPGTGLGLTIVRTILDQHGAPISVHSSPDQGTTFMFRLPVAR